MRGFNALTANQVFTNCFTGVSPADARPWMTNVDVLSLKVFGLVLNPVANPGGLVLQWKNNFVLQSATNLTGAYADVPGAPDPYTNPPSSGPQKFFRLRQ